MSALVINRAGGRRQLDRRPQDEEGSGTGACDALRGSHATRGGGSSLYHVRERVSSPRNPREQLLAVLTYRSPLASSRRGGEHAFLFIPFGSEMSAARHTKALGRTAWCGERNRYTGLYQIRKQT